jgi:hypothetical protein
MNLQMGDPTIEEIIKNINEKKTTNTQGVSQIIVKEMNRLMPKEEEPNLNPCEKHGEPKDLCLQCEFIDMKEKPNTEYQIAKAFYVKYSEPIRHYSFKENGTTDQALEMRKNELRFYGKKIIHSHQAGDIDTLLFLSDSAQERMFSDSEIKVFSYLFGKHFPIKKLTGKDPVKLTELTQDEQYDLTRTRKHVFECQIRTIKEKLRRIQL